MNRRALLLSLAPCLLLAACDPVGGDPDAGRSDAGPASLEVGTGEGIFASIEDGQTLDLVSGCQGAQHVWTALRSSGLDPRGTIIDLALVRDRDAMVVSQTFRVRVSMTPVSGTGYAEVAGLTLVVPDPDAALMEDLTLRAVVTDMNGVEVTDERSVRVAWGEGGCL